MASVKIASAADRFPVGTVVEAYRASDFPPGWQGAPPVAGVSAAAVVADGSVTFAGLAEGVAYKAYASVGGADRIVSFTAPRTPIPVTGGVTRLHDVTDLDATALVDGNVVYFDEASDTFRGAVPVPAEVVPPPGPETWRVDVTVFTAPVVLSGLQNMAQGAIVGQRYSSVPAIGDKIGWDLGLSAGTWDISILCAGACAQVTAKIDGVSVGSVDLGAVPAGTDHLVSIPGIVIADSGKHRVVLEVTAPGSGPASLYFKPQAVSLVRTA